MTGEAVYAGADAKIPAAGSEIKRVSDVAAQLVKQPDVRGLTPLQRSQIANWEIPATSTVPFTVFEKTVFELQEAMTKGITTSEDVTREFLSRLSRFDRNGPTLRSVLSINPRAIADARQRDTERAQGPCPSVCSTASLSSTKTILMRPSCRPPVAHSRCSIIVPALIRASRPA